MRMGRWTAWRMHVHRPTRRARGRAPPPPEIRGLHPLRGIRLQRAVGTQPDAHWRVNNAPRWGAEACARLHTPPGRSLSDQFFFLLRTTNRQPPTPINHQPPPTAANRQRQPTATNCQPPTANRHQPWLSTWSARGLFWENWFRNTFFFPLRTALHSAPHPPPPPLGRGAFVPWPTHQPTPQPALDTTFLWRHNSSELNQIKANLQKGPEVGG